MASDDLSMAPDWFDVLLEGAKRTDAQKKLSVRNLRHMADAVREALAGVEGGETRAALRWALPLAREHLTEHDFPYGKTDRAQLESAERLAGGGGHTREKVPVVPPEDDGESKGSTPATATPSSPPPARPAPPTHLLECVECHGLHPMEVMNSTTPDGEGSPICPACVRVAVLEFRLGEDSTGDVKVQLQPDKVEALLEEGRELGEEARERMDALYRGPIPNIRLRSDVAPPTEEVSWAEADEALGSIEMALCELIVSPEDNVWMQGVRVLRRYIAQRPVPNAPPTEGEVEEEIEGTLAELAAVVPTNWCDSLLSGPDAVLPDGVYTPHHIECLLLSLRQRMAPHLEDLRDHVQAQAEWSAFGPVEKIGADRLADEVAVLVRRGVLDARSPAGDALLDYREPPCSERSDRLVALERERDTAQARAEALEGALRDARPVVANAIHADGAQPWQVETRQEILARIDAALAPQPEGQETE